LIRSMSRMLVQIRPYGVSCCMAEQCTDDVIIEMVWDAQGIISHTEEDSVSSILPSTLLYLTCLGLHDAVHWRVMYDLAHMRE
jgi:hypothetical protein